ncbi:hypothetical protein B4U80_15046, partial [Leptotrombidium deliense]
MGKGKREIARILQRSPSTIVRWSERWNSRQTLQRQPGSGRRGVLSLEDEAAIERCVEEDRFHEADDIIRVLQLTCSPTTLTRSLRRMGFRNRIAVEKTELNEDQKKKRLDWCRER